MHFFKSGVSLYKRIWISIEITLLWIFSKSYSECCLAIDSFKQIEKWTTLGTRRTAYEGFYSMNIANNFYRVRNCSTTCEGTHYDIKDTRYTCVVHHTLNYQQDDAILT